MNLREEDLNLLAVFEALMETRSLSRASERLGLSQSSLSHNLAKLRRSFDDPMFMRIKNEMVPTPRALPIAPAVKQVLALARGEIFQHRAFAPERSSRIFTLCRAGRPGPGLARALPSGHCAPVASPDGARFVRGGKRPVWCVRSVWQKPAW